MPFSREPLLKTLLEASPSGMLLVGEDGTIAYANTLAVEMFGYPPEALLGLSVDRLVPRQHRGGHDRLRHGYSAAPTRRQMGTGRDLLAERQDGLLFPVEIALNPLEHKGQRWVLCSIVDISVRKALAAEQAQAQQQAMEVHRLESLGLLAGGVAHDFNNLLSVILGNACLALPLVPAHGQVHACIGDIIEASEKAADLARQMLAYSGRGKFQITTLDVSAVVLELASLLRSTLPRHVQLRLQCPAGLPPIQGDAAQLRQILFNLVNNGAEAIARQGRVSVSTDMIDADALYLTHFQPPGLAAGRYILLEVTDNGSGMSPEVRDAIFEPFFSTKESGHGLGLAAVLGIIRGHRGGVRVYSEPGRGSTFKVLLPVHEQDASQDLAPHSKGTILFADDEPTVRRLLRRMLGSDYDLIETEDGQQAVERFRQEQQRIDLVLLDLSMPRLDGAEAARQIQALAPEVPIIISSGFNQQESTADLQACRLAGFLQKPYPPEALLSMIRKALEGAGSVP